MDETSLQMTKPQMKVSNCFRMRTRFKPAPVEDCDGTPSCTNPTRQSPGYYTSAKVVE